MKDGKEEEEEEEEDEDEDEGGRRRITGRQRHCEITVLVNLGISFHPVWQAQ